MGDTRITFNVPSPEIKRAFFDKANKDKGSMTSVLNSWVDSYLEGGLFPKRDMLFIFTSILFDMVQNDLFPLMEGLDRDDLLSLVDELVSTKLNLPYVVPPAELDFTAGDLLKQIRLRMGFSLRKAVDFIFEKTGVSLTAQNLSRIECQSGFPREETIEPILKAYGLSFDEFSKLLVSYKEGLG